ncbi:hypothetical protein B5U98_26795 [Bosea sp. Tri-39]|nr:hypothetical protein BLM15_28990 [Bosea sp. Tri-49]RXT16773.1 hypothetical protein B5U98_26795 [Bosea sp. Tri-39]RXT37529.1 hypothetical protein B5U99_12620 [Bosea sp. Tri-54]
MNLRDGHTTEVLYQFASDFDDRRAGYLLFDTTKFEDGQFCHRLILECDDGTTVVLVVMNRSDKVLAFHGRVLEPVGEAAVSRNF